MNERKISFGELRNAYLTLQGLLQKASGEKVANSKARLQEDLSLWGDDSYFFLVDFVEKYELNFDEFDYSKHLYYEYELSSSTSALLVILLLPLLLVKGILALIVRMFSKELANKITEFDLVPKAFRQREVTDLTMADLITSLTEKKFTLRSELRYVLTGGKSI